jgi:hypothetical protein
MAYWNIVERQTGPECGFEAIENFLQCYWPLSNALSEISLKFLAQQRGYLLPDGSLDVNGYIPLLQQFRITARWAAFDHGELISALRQHRRVIAVVDAHQIDYLNYIPESGHAIVLTRSVTNNAHSIVHAYRGFDSNFEGEERQWDAAAMERAADFSAPSSLLIADQAVPVTARQPHIVRL